MPGRRGGGGAGADRHGRFTLLSSMDEAGQQFGSFIWRLNGSNSTAAAPSKIVERKTNPGTRDDSRVLTFCLWVGWGWRGWQAVGHLIDSFGGLNQEILWAFGVRDERKRSAKDLR